MTYLPADHDRPHHTPSDGPQLDDAPPKARLELSERSTSVPLATFHLEGVGQGNLDSLRYRPFADFHPIERVELKADRAELLYERPLRPIRDRHKVTREEVVNLTRQLIEAKRRLVANQSLYLYPGLEAFGVDPSTNRLRFRLINVRPKERFRVSTHDQLSVEALCALIEHLAPGLWAKVAPRRAELHTLEALLRLIEPKQGWRAVFVGLKVLFYSALLALFASVPLAIWGPEQVSAPLRELLMPRVNAFLDALEERRELLQPRAQMSVELTLTLQATPEHTSSELTLALNEALCEVVSQQRAEARCELLTHVADSTGDDPKVTPAFLPPKPLIPSPFVPSEPRSPEAFEEPAFEEAPSEEPPSEEPQLWRAKVSYRGDLNRLLSKTLELASAKLKVSRASMPVELEVLMSMSAPLQVRALTPLRPVEPLKPSLDAPQPTGGADTITP